MPVLLLHNSCCWLLGGLQNELPDRQREGGIVMAGPDTFGLPPRRRPGSILRRQVIAQPAYYLHHAHHAQNYVYSLDGLHRKFVADAMRLLHNVGWSMFSGIDVLS